MPRILALIALALLSDRVIVARRVPGALPAKSRSRSGAMDTGVQKLAMRKDNTKVACCGMREGALPSKVACCGQSSALVLVAALLPLRSPPCETQPGIHEPARARPHISPPNRTIMHSQA